MNLDLQFLALNSWIWTCNWWVWNHTFESQLVLSSFQFVTSKSWLVSRVLPHHFFPCNRNSTEMVLFFAAIVKLNGENSCIKSFFSPDLRRNKYVCYFLRRKVPFLVLRKILLNVKRFSLWGFKHWKTVWFSQEDNTYSITFF